VFDEEGVQAASRKKKQKQEEAEEARKSRSKPLRAMPEVGTRVVQMYGADSSVRLLP
jgi:hypothetical protein